MSMILIYKIAYYAKKILDDFASKQSGRLPIATARDRNDLPYYLRPLSIYLV